MRIAIRVVMFLFLVAPCLCSSAQVEVVEQKRFEHNGVVSTSVTPNNKVITYSIISERGEDDQLELVAYNEHFEEEGRFQTKCAKDKDESIGNKRKEFVQFKKIKIVNE